MTILKVKDVSYSYEGSSKIVLNDINVDFECGKIYSIIGKSGAGKTTFLSLISGLDSCKEGYIFYNGESLGRIDRDEYRAKNIGVIFQGYNLLTNYSAVENVVLSMNISNSDVKDKKAFAYDILNKVGIDKSKADRTILKLSGGEQQRVAIARALSHNPDIIIADEPTGNLDENTEKDILEIFKDLAHKEDKCVIIVTHSKEVSSFADNVCALNQGKMLFVK